MRYCGIAAASAVLVILSAAPAQACRIPVHRNLSDIQYADVVVVARITKYKIVLNDKARRDRKKMLANSPDMPPLMRKILEEQKNFMSDHALLHLVVDEVLLGKAGRSLTATWDNSTFAEPASMPSGPFLIGLKGSGGRLPPLRGPSATILPDPETGSLAVLQAPCAPPFIIESKSEDARVIRQILRRTSKIRGG